MVERGDGAVAPGGDVLSPVVFLLPAGRASLGTAPHRVEHPGRQHHRRQGEQHQRQCPPGERGRLEPVGDPPGIADPPGIKPQRQGHQRHGHTEGQQTIPEDL
ncbi:MAG: hypothetical protein ACK559_27285, partial [bacterium]